jgi:hypothetical protein
MPHPHPSRRPGFGGQAHASQKKKEVKVAKYKRFAQYQKALREVAVSGARAAPDSHGTDLHAMTGQDGQEPAVASSEFEAAPTGSAGQKKRKKLSAAAQARRKWEEDHAAVIAEREAAARAKEERLRQQELNRKHRKDQAVKLSKRNRRGQPVLGFEVERLLSNLKR